jgi:exopolysaccharide production protein ExoY
LGARISGVAFKQRLLRGNRIGQTAILSLHKEVLREERLSADGVITKSSVLLAIDAGGARRMSSGAAALRHTFPLRYKRHQPLGGTFKRAIDIVVSSVAILAAMPLMLFAAMAVRLYIGGPVIFAHRRIGFEGRRFNCYKFRTMGPDADEALGKYFAANPEAEREWNVRQKLRDDPRVCSLGKLLRKSSIDELPQLFNVLRGDMSLVGPRPIVDSEVGRYGAHLQECFKARPGVSGIWQVSGRNRLSYEKRVLLDRYYVRRWSPWLDAKILFKTIAAVLNRETS